MTVDEYHNSDLLKNLKSELLQGKVPDTCKECKLKENLGLKSMRSTMWGWNNVGPEPVYEDMPWYGIYNVDTPLNPIRIELRSSNICNMKCRQCDEMSSSMWAKEKIEHSDNPKIKFRSLGHKNLYFNKQSDGIIHSVSNITKSITDLALTATNLKCVCLCGGEPFLIKEYYDFLDTLIENKVNEKIELEIFTNCSVNNTRFTDRLRKFTKVVFNMSVDGVGKTAEYIRHGTNWNSVEKNILNFNSLKGVFEPGVNIAISSYTILDASNLAKFLMRLYEDNNNIFHKGYYCNGPPVANFRNLPAHLRLKAIYEIDQALQIITVPNYNALKKELLVMREILKNETPLDPQAFIQNTKMLDEIRGENFEDVFGLKLEN
jgi:organic radical activating enzyme